MTSKPSTQDIDRLQQLLDGHGADEARWPVSDAAIFAAAMKQTAVGRRMIAETGALDRILAMAPAGNPDRMAGLIERISSTAASIRPAGPGSAEIVTLPVKTAVPVAPRVEALPRRIAVWPVFGALAASLVIGIYVGTLSPAATELQRVAGVAVDETEQVQAAVQLAGEEPVEGELL